jgi:hypothetical protein
MEADVAQWLSWSTALDLVPHELPIPEPPCKHCRFWQPRQRTNEIGDVIGVICCTAFDMLRDFNCFERRDQ